MLKDYYMNVHYHPCNANMVVDSLSKMSVGCTTHIEDEKKELAKDVDKLAILSVRFVDYTNGGVSIHPSSESPYVV